MTAYYNEIDTYAAQWLRNLIAAGCIAPGDVDERSITDVRTDDLKGYTQCHFFAGIGVWSYALRLAGWPDDQPVWTGSCPCQPFSSAGKGEGTADERHLWPVWFDLIRKCRPDVVFGEQVEAAINYGWLDLVQSDLEGEGYACGALGIPACGVGAPHIRQRLWFFASSNTNSARNERLFQTDSTSEMRQGWENCEMDLQSIYEDPFIHRRSFDKPLIRKMDDGFATRVGRLRAYGNAIVPQVAAEIIGAYMETTRAGETK